MSEVIATDEVRRNPVTRECELMTIEQGRCPACGGHGCADFWSCATCGGTGLIDLRKPGKDPTMTDQGPVVAALAEAMEEAAPKYKGETLVFWASIALQAIAANPDILREYGIGRLPTRSEWYAAINPNLYYNYYSQEWTNKMFQHLSDAGYISPDPQPPEPTLPSMLGRIMYESVKPCLWEGASDYQKTLFIHQAEALLAEFDITPKAPRP